jgi:threonine/homoserine/homoserine lactone efflux protein
LGNPKAILFYMGVLTGFFDLTKVAPVDIITIVVVSISIPLLGNLILASFGNKARAFLQSPRAVRRINIVSGMLLIVVGLMIPFV